MNRKRRFQNRPAYLRWCFTCNVPLIDKKCGLCGEKGKAIQVSKPGESRFAMSHERRIILNLFADEYGAHPKRVINKKTIILNKTTGIDRVDEIIIDGIIVGILEFDIFKKIFRYIPSVQGCAAFEKLTNRKMKVKLENRRHLKGKYINSCEVEIPDGQFFRKGDYAILVFKNGKVGKGLIKKDLQDGEKTIKVLDILPGNIKLPKTGSSLEKIINANTGALKMLEKEAESFMTDCVKKFRKPVNVAFSGGKDSLVVLDIARKTGNLSEIIFIDTGIEFPETLEYVKKMQKLTRTKIRCVRSGKNFFDEAEINGPPAKDDRWCSKTHKIEPMASYIKLNYPEGCITFEGKRKHESQSRSLSGRIENNPFIEGQTSCYPVFHWSSLAIWIYIFYKKLKYNSLYDKGFERVGCWMCPAAFDCEFCNMKEMHPELYKKYSLLLKKWAQKTGFGKKYLHLGLWRWKTLPNKIVRITEKEKK
ncbi:MAG: phosphoadenosine phosphosulfate reductase family protein [archaeon]|nr:phosphoadenosine phosphosulfate reductase family protein [archaeon]